MYSNATDFERPSAALPIGSIANAERQSSIEIFESRTWLDKIAFFLLWCFVFSVPFETTVKVGDSTVSRLIGAALFPVALLVLLARSWIRSLAFAHWWTIAFTGWVAMSYLWTVWPADTYDRLSTHLQILIIVIVIWQLSTGPNDGQHLAKAYVLGTVVVCCETFLRYAANETDVSKFGRYTARGADPNDLGLALALSIPLSYYFFLRQRGWSGTGWLLQIGAASVTCLLTASRTGAIVMLLSLAIIPFTISELRKQQKYTLAAGTIAAILACAIVVPPSSWKRLSTISKEVTTGTLDVRTEIWASGIEAFKTAPLLGVGAGAFQDAVAPRLSFYDDQHAYVAHNTFISVMTELGIVGLILFLAIFGSVIGAAFRITPPLLRKAWLLTLIVWAVGVFTLTWENKKPTWVLFALILQTSAAGELVRPRGDRNSNEATGRVNQIATRLAMARSTR